MSVNSNSINALEEIQDFADLEIRKSQETISHEEVIKDLKESGLL